MILSSFILIFLLLIPGQTFAQSGIIGADTPVNYPPVADPQEVITVKGIPIMITLSGDDANGDSIAFDLVEAPLHGNLNGFEPATGSVIYTPDPGFSGFDSFTFQVNDGIADSDPATVMLSVTTFLHTLTITKSGLGGGTVTSIPIGLDCGSTCEALFDDSIAVTLAATQAPGSVFTGWSGDPDCSDGVITMDANKTCTASFVTRLALATLSLPTAEAGVVYNAPLISGGLAPYTIKLTKGVFPSGLSGNTANGRLTGTPTKSSTKGTSFTVQVADQLGSSVTGAFKIKILAAVSISTKSLKAGTHGKSYSGSLSATGGQTPNNWSLVSAPGTLPTGFTLNSSTGAITGITTQVGTFNPTFKVIDSLGGHAQRNFALTIN
jgi:hypothetical protein